MTMDLTKPLAYRVRPKTLEEFVGQEEVLGKNKILYRTIVADRLSSIVLWGPTGCGKTSLAKVISNTTKAKFVHLNAVTAGVSDIKKLLKKQKIRSSILQENVYYLLMRYIDLINYNKMLYFLM